MELDALEVMIEKLKSKSPEVRAEFELRDKVKDLLLPFCEGGDLLEWHGHYCKEEDWRKDGWWEPAEKRLKGIVKEAFLFGLLTPPMLQKFLDAIEAGVELDDPLKMGRPSVREHACPSCSQKFQLGFNG